MIPASQVGDFVPVVCAGFGGVSAVAPLPQLELKDTEEPEGSVRFAFFVDCLGAPELFTVRAG